MAIREHVLWVKRDDSPVIDDEELLLRAGVEDQMVPIQTISLSKWGSAQVPAGSRDESGGITPLLAVHDSVLSPAGRVYVVSED